MWTGLAVSGCTPLHELRTVELMEASEVIRATTEDGAELALHHYEPWGEASTIPVIVCHGIASNRHTWALGQDRDFGLYLSQRGFDTYLLDLRGHGESSRADPSTSIDTYATRDVPAAIAAVMERTGAPAVAWVGHSMGGLSLVAYLERVPDAPVAAAVTVASPLDWRGDDFMTGLAHTLLRVLSGKNPVHTRDLAAFYAQWQGEIPLQLDKAVYEPSNMERGPFADMMRVGISPIQAGVVKQFRDTIAAEAFVSADGSMNYLEGASSIEVPFLVVAGRADRLCAPERTLTFFETLGSEDKTWRVFGLDHGDSADFGHVDLCNGDRARDDVYPYISDWLMERLGGR